jgi:hypothetical protein
MAAACGADVVVDAVLLLLLLLRLEAAGLLPLLPLAAARLGKEAEAQRQVRRQRRRRWRRPNATTMDGAVARENSEVSQRHREFHPDATRMRAHDP